jgi:hypothetical protein
MNFMTSRRTVLASLAGIATLCAGGAIGRAAPSRLAAPTEKPILTIAGKIGLTNKGETAQFDRAMLESLGMVSFATTTPWYKGAVTFEGVPLRKVMESVGASGERIVAVALNDYSVEVPMDDVAKYNVILALKRDGEYMPVRDKGPLFIVYPFDSDPELKSQKFYSRSVWQVARLEIK